MTFEPPEASGKSIYCHSLPSSDSDDLNVSESDDDDAGSSHRSELASNGDIDYDDIVS